MILASSVFATGCAQTPSRVELPAYSDGAGSAAVAEYDTNKDGKISGAELAKSASLQAAIEQIDTNADKAITADEIDARIGQWREQKVALMPVSCKVLLNGTPVENAKVTFQPEAFLGGQLHPATGETDADGVAKIKLAPEHVKDAKFDGFVPTGFYKISVEVGGKRYATGPRTGCEVSGNAVWAREGLVVAEFESR